MSMAIKSYRDLKVWQKSMDIAEDIYALTAQFPKQEIYGLTSQMRRAAISIPSNIAEGSMRRARGDFARFINIASGSLAELETQLMLALRLNYITKNQFAEIESALEQVSKMLYALHSKLKISED
jgi:four helix bundle protein